MYIPRIAESMLLDFAAGYPVLIVTGPRQSGKSTLVRHAFPERTCVSLEDLDQRRGSGYLPTVAEDVRGPGCWLVAGLRLSQHLYQPA